MINATNVIIGEIVGTILLVLLGDGVCANVTLNKSGFKAAGPLFIALGWGLAVALPAACFSGICPASYNPALTIALFADGTLSTAAGYSIGVIVEMIIAELVGGFIGAVLVWVAFKPQFDASADLGDGLRGIFCTAPGVRNLAYNTLQEAIATFWLVFAIKAACGPYSTLALNGKTVATWGGTLAVFFIIISCGTSFGGLTGYAMNAARDTAPRLAYAILPIKGKGDADWSYGLTAPLIGPIIGALVAVGVYAILPI